MFIMAVDKASAGLIKWEATSQAPSDRQEGEQPPPEGGPEPSRRALSPFENSSMTNTPPGRRSQPSLGTCPLPSGKSVWVVLFFSPAREAESGRKSVDEQVKMPCRSLEMVPQQTRKACGDVQTSSIAGIRRSFLAEEALAHLACFSGLRKTPRSPAPGSHGVSWG